MNAALTAKLTAAADTYRAVGQTFNAVRRGVDEVSSTLSRVEARQGRGHGGGDTAGDADADGNGDGDGDGDPAVAALARLVAECAPRRVRQAPRGGASLAREAPAAKPRRAARSSSRSASALARDLRVRLAHRESYIVRLTERLAHQSQRRASAAAGGSFAAAAAELFRPANGPARADDVSADDVSGATASAVAQLAAHRADVLAARAREAGVTWLRDARDTEARAAAAARAGKANGGAVRGFPFPSRRGALRGRRRPGAGGGGAGRRARAGRARTERRRARARGRDRAPAGREEPRVRRGDARAAGAARGCRREEAPLASGASEVDAKSADAKTVATRDASHPKRGAPRLAARRDGAENARPADARQDAKRQRRAPREMDPFAARARQQLRVVTGRQRRARRGARDDLRANDYLYVRYARVNDLITHHKTRARFFYLPYYALFLLLSCFSSLVWVSPSSATDKAPRSPPPRRRRRAIWRSPPPTCPR